MPNVSNWGDAFSERCVRRMTSPRRFAAVQIELLCSPQHRSPPNRERLSQLGYYRPTGEGTTVRPGRSSLQVVV